MTSSDLWDETTAAAYDDEVSAEFAPEVVGPAVDYLHGLAEGGPALELAVGTGRIGIPLGRLGTPVTGVELSESMVAQLRRKVDAQTLPVVVGDMATATVPGDFSLVFLVVNSLANLRTQQEQVACFRNAARHLRAGGRFVIELWVPDLRALTPGTGAVAREVRDGYAAFDTYDVATQECTSQSFRRHPDGTVRHDRGSFRYVWPAECDLMATLAGLTFETRVASFRGDPFDATSPRHVSVWRKP